MTQKDGKFYYFKNYIYINRVLKKENNIFTFYEQLFTHWHMNKYFRAIKHTLINHAVLSTHPVVLTEAPDSPGGPCFRICDWPEHPSYKKRLFQSQHQLLQLLYVVCTSTKLKYTEGSKCQTWTKFRSSIDLSNKIFLQISKEKKTHQNKCFICNLMI